MRWFLPIILALLAVGTANAQEASQPVASEVEAFIEDSRSLRQTLIPTVALVTLLSVAPGIAMMITCFPFIAIIFSFLRQALGLQTAPPAMMMTSLAIFLTYFIMEPVFSDAWTTAVKPALDGELNEMDAAGIAIVPFRDFMETRVSEDTLFRLADAVERPIADVPSADLSLLIPSFMLSEITRAFQIGFAIFLPFLVIDLVVASVLMAMGMMMVPPAVVALPFKLAFFVLADGWVNITEALLRGYLP
ncbi:flagellar type III secretion system pore protein FliP [Parvularcula lutaonensis]|uniref:Flagellar biosynthetic protein FliP n=1 Tax=Parvularcula lutaonensis TaxID=491923 RepID=A0ABV7MF73_9PROT|nr:flagellar type III secretion system pore protein FliP [Parvularcula lutaonensis]GGY51571.1 flagellar biosynthetic protein FliP [Parvularcula lutaonensis]